MKREVQRGEQLAKGQTACWQDPDGVEGRAKGNQTPDFPPVPVSFLLQRLKYLLTPREPNRWAVDRDGGALYSSHSAMNGTLVKPTHIIVETMM